MEDNFKVKDTADSTWFREVVDTPISPLYRTKSKREKTIDDVYQFILETFSNKDFNLFLIMEQPDLKFKVLEHYITDYDQFLAFQLFTLEQMIDKNLDDYITLIGIIKSLGLYSMNNANKKMELVKGFCLSQNLHSDVICIFIY